jgi:hypothetical protein
MSKKAIATAANLLNQTLDWDYIQEASIIHAVTPLLYYGLNQVLRHSGISRPISNHILTHFENLFQQNQARNNRLYNVIGQISQAFELANIPLLGLKDIQLAREVYPDIGLRPIGDLDLLIHHQDYPKAAQCMAELGFLPLPDPNIPFTLKYAWAHHFRRSTDNVWVDVQWNVLQLEWDKYGEGSFDFEIDRMWRNATVMHGDSWQLLVPKPEDMLFHLCMHLEGHAYAELILFCDIVELLQTYQNRFNWLYLLELGKKYRVESSIFYVLLLTQRLFDITLPPFILNALKPAYFKAGMFEPIFGNLNNLHLSLDEIKLAINPPANVLNEFEVIVRQQTVCAQQLYKVVDQIASDFTQAGANLIIFEESSSQKIFPDPTLKPFEEIRLLILKHSLSDMRRTLLEAGFEPDPNRPNAYRQQKFIKSVDPVLVNRLPRLILEVELEENADGLPLTPEQSPSKKRLAGQLLKTKLTGHAPLEFNCSATIRVITLNPEDMLLYLLVQLAQPKPDRLFSLISVFEFFNGYSTPIDWQKIAHKAKHNGVAAPVGEGLWLAQYLVSEHIPPAAVSLVGGATLPPRLLQWARYGPSSLKLYTAFKKPFLYLFSLLSINGTGAKTNFLLKSWFGSRSNKAILPGLLLETIKAVPALFQNKPLIPTDFAYWIEPEPSSDLNIAQS